MAKAKKKVTKKRAKKKANVSRGTPLTREQKVQARKDLRAEQAKRYKA